MQQMPEVNNLNEGKVYFGSQFQSMVTCLRYFWAYVEAEHHCWSTMAEKTAHLTATWT
jgi:hypothetical protein